MERDEAVELLKARRLAVGLSQREVARRAGLNHSDMSRLESGERASWGRIGRVAEALGLDPRTLAEVRDVESPSVAAEAELARAVELVAAALPDVAVRRLVGELFPAAEWSAVVRVEAAALVRAEWERAVSWGERIRGAYRAAEMPMAASAGVPSGEAEERLFLERMRRALGRAS